MTNLQELIIKRDALIAERDAIGMFYGDHELFESRIQWATREINDLENLMQEADEPIPFIKAVMAIRDAQQGIASGHMVGLDACGSGLQLMGALIGCESTCYNTGLVNPNWRADAYTVISDDMHLPSGESCKSLGIDRQMVKEAAMPRYYGSKEKPKEVFGEGTEAYTAFYETLNRCFPGANELMDIMINSWQPYALSHQCTYPDGFVMKCKVMQTKDMKVEVEELGKASFTHRYMENEGSERGLELAAHIVHGCDGFVVRELSRRCNYDKEQLITAREICHKVLLERTDYGMKPEEFTSLVHVEDLGALFDLPTYHLQALVKLINNCLSYKAFPVVTNHDEYRCHANNCNRMRQVWVDVMAEIADSNLGSKLISEIRGVEGTLTKLSNRCGELIRGGNYGIC